MFKNKLSKEIKVLFFSIVTIISIAFGVYVFTYSTKSEVIIATEQNNQTSLVPSLIRSFNHRSGHDNAKVQIVEFYDPECESCAAFFPFVSKVKALYKNEIQLITRYALYHGNSLMAAKASDAAGLQGKFWEFQELLFLNQHKWSHQQTSALSYFLEYAKDLSLDLQKFQTDMEDPKILKNIMIDIEDGKSLGVNGTPTFFINGRKLLNINPNSFNEEIENELKK
jgi:protein-disulfide isomerase